MLHLVIAYAKITHHILNDSIRNVGVLTDTFRLFNEVNATTSTGIVTFFNINDGEIDSSLLIKPNDIFWVLVLKK